MKAKGCLVFTFSFLVGQLALLPPVSYVTDCAVLYVQSAV